MVCRYVPYRIRSSSYCTDRVMVSWHHGFVSPDAISTERQASLRSLDGHSRCDSEAARNTGRQHTKVDTCPNGYLQHLPALYQQWQDQPTDAGWFCLGRAGPQQFLHLALWHWYYGSG